MEGGHQKCCSDKQPCHLPPAACHTTVYEAIREKRSCHLTLSRDYVGQHPGAEDSTLGRVFGSADQNLVLLVYLKCLCLQPQWLPQCTQVEFEAVLLCDLKCPRGQKNV